MRTPLPALTSLLLALSLPALASPAAAQPRRMPALDVRPQGGGGLPLGCRHTSQELIAAAREMRAVRTAVDVFQARGYIAMPSADRAVNGCALGARASAVALAYRKPGLDFFDDSTKVAQPLIVVSTRADPGNPDESITEVSAGIVVFDGVTRRFSTNEQLGMMPGEPVVDVVERPGGGPRLEPEGDPFWKRLNRWAWCTGTGAWGCTVSAYVHPTGRLLFTSAQTAAALVGACMIGSGIGCLWMIGAGD